MNIVDKFLPIGYIIGMKNIALKIAKVLRAKGFQSVYAGGVVRDMLLGVESSDIDIATSATPDQVESLFERTIPVGRSFGVIRVLEDMTEFEVATFRMDSRTGDGRRPDGVEFSSMEEDAKRRDFTINGLFYDPIENKVMDFVGGKEDIDKGIIRFIGDAEERIEEDRLRILRGIRFAVRFGFKIENETFAAIKRNADRILDVSMERIQQELVKMIELGKPRMMLELLDESGLLRYILPEIAALKGVQQDPIWHPEGDTWTHTCLVMEGLVGKSIELQVAGLFHDVGKPMTTVIEGDRIKSPGHAKAGAKITREVLERLKFPCKFTDYVGELVYEHMKIINVPDMKKSGQKIFFAQDNFLDLRELHIADKKAGKGDTPELELVDVIYAKLKEESLKPVPFVDGRDLLDLGFSTGNILGKFKQELYERQLEGEFPDKEAALTFAKSRLGA